MLTFKNGSQNITGSSSIRTARRLHCGHSENAYTQRNQIRQVLSGKQTDVSENRGSPKIIQFNRVFHYKPSILGYPYFWKHPNIAERSFFSLRSGFFVLQVKPTQCVEQYSMHNMWEYLSIYVEEYINIPLHPKTVKTMQVFFHPQYMGDNLIYNP